MEKLSVSVMADGDGLLVTLPVAALAHGRERFRLPAGATYGDLAAEAERMALERWEGGIMWRLALPVGDCGHLTLPVGKKSEEPDSAPREEAADAEAQDEEHVEN